MHYTHLGHFLIAPNLRRLGIGTATWNAAIGHAGDRTIGLDALPAQVDRYARLGFRPAWRTIRLAGPVPPQLTLGSGTITEPITTDLGQMAAWDATCFPADRHCFALAFAGDTGGYTLVSTTGKGRVDGYPRDLHGHSLRPAGFHVGLKFSPRTALAHGSRSS